MTVGLLVPLELLVRVTPKTKRVWGLFQKHQGKGMLVNFSSLFKDLCVVKEGKGRGQVGVP